MVVSLLIYHLKINTAGVIPAIFASALLLLPVTLTTNFGFADSDTFLNISSMFTQGQPLVHVTLCIRNYFLFFFLYFDSF